MESPDKKVKQLASFIQKNPDDSFSKFALALEFLKKDQINKAKILFEDIRNNDPYYDGVYYHLGRLYEMTGRREQALETYKKGVAVAAQNNHKRNVAELKDALAELQIEMGIGNENQF